MKWCGRNVDDASASNHANISQILRQSNRHLKNHVSGEHAKYETRCAGLVILKIAHEFVRKY